MMAAALTLKHLRAERPILLFDTFSGMTRPTDADKDLNESLAYRQFATASERAPGDRWCEAAVGEVRRNMEATGYRPSMVKYVVGPVEETLPEHAPDGIAYLRLDTDWYESTMHELVHLYPLVARLGVISIDDYGHWQGARKAVDEYLSKSQIVCLLHRIDYTGRQFVKA
jgi:hypothetical protein